MIARLLISASLQQRIGEIKKIIAEAELKNPHPDLLYFSSEAKLGIEQARIIKEHFSLKPYSSLGRGVVLEDASSLTDEAQNALLKTLEELPEYGLFILATDSDLKLLPTVLSRCQIVRMQPSRLQAKSSYPEEIEKLLKSTVEQRFEYIEKLNDREEFLHALVSYFHQQLQESTHARTNLAGLNQFLKALLQAEEWQKQNVNIRAILEYLMLVMPSKL